MKGSEAKERAYASQMPVQRGEKALYKVQLSEGDSGGLGDHAEDAAARSRQPGSRPPNL
jgi:hypothetical protein